MTALSVTEWRLLVLARGDTPAESANARGHLFEAFVAKLLHGYGYNEPTRTNLNVASDGIEIDVVAKSRLGSGRAIAECKAYSRPVAAGELTKFLGKLTMDRYTSQDTLGLMIVVPRLTSDGEQAARKIESNDSRFLYLDAGQMVDRLHSEGYLAPTPSQLEGISDPAVLVSNDGIFGAALQLDEQTREPVRVIAWSKSGTVPDSTLELVSQHEWAQALPVIDVAHAEDKPPSEITSEPHILVRVQGSSEDFQYQLPAAPRFFVGRGVLLKQLERLHKTGNRLFVFNAQSGWGKSSLALKFGQSVSTEGGVAFVMDTRTAHTTRYIVEVLRDAAEEAEANGVLRLPAEPFWASLASGLMTLNRATWSNDKSLLLFFDQFENVFRDEELTRGFRDLALGAKELDIPLLIGFAWKTDLVGWVEGHPFQLREDIRSNASVITVEPFGPTEVTTLLNRLEKRVQSKLVPDLRSRLREYSQGLPWLLKKLADHVLRELESGATQEQLLAEALNVEGLFKADLAQLTPVQFSVLHHVARYAPIPASEVIDRYSPEAVQSLVDQRLLVQVGDRLDTYWDTFRDYLNTGSVPIEDSYILGQMPGSIARLLPVVMETGGAAGVRELADRLQTSDTVVFNVSRVLRLLGISTYEPLTVRIAQHIVDSSDPELAIRKQIADALRRHKALSTARAVSERNGGVVTVDLFATALPRAFPAIDVKFSTWQTYARAFLAWFVYAGFFEQQGSGWHQVADPSVVKSKQLLTARSAMNARAAVPFEAWGPAKEVLDRVGRGEVVMLDDDSVSRRAVRPLMGLGAITVTSQGEVRVAAEGLLDERGELNPLVLRGLIESAPGGATGLRVLASGPAATPSVIGEAIRAAIGADWTKSSVHSVGGYFRSWSKAAGVDVRPTSRAGIKQRTRKRVAPSEESLF